jgi:mannitol/fructose-specific phosphotransferase system IIA component (Ntr-type)
MGLVAIGVIWHNLYVTPRVAPRVGAVAKMAERLGQRLLERDADALGLRTELRQLLKEKGVRDYDLFSQVVRDAEFVEVHSDVDCEEVIRLGADQLSRQSGISRDLIYGAMLERTRLGETPADAGVALPHLLLNEVKGFHMIAVRSIHGLEFPMAKQSIHAVFMLLGNRDNPTQHLRFLAALARRAENPHFIDDWIAAGSVEELAELLLADEV